MKFTDALVLRSWSRSPLLRIFNSAAAPEKIEQSARCKHLPGTRRVEEVVVALGSNVGDRVANFEKALQLMKDAGIFVVSHANLYESAPAYVTDQPKFLNSAVKAHTVYDAYTVLDKLKNIEKELGRVDGGIRYGPRPIDLDILFFDDHTISSESLTIPHPRIWERPFVLAPLMDLHSTKPADHFYLWPERFFSARRAWKLMGGDALFKEECLTRVMPLGKTLWDWSRRTHVMGILNVTPDSFSDGGKFLSVPDAVARAEAMIAEGVDVIDIGAQSTRPGATRLTTEEELERLLPVVRAIAKLAAKAESVHLSVDTFDAKVAKEAVLNGVHMVNDVSGGSFDPAMHSTVAKLGVPYVLMHMRGNSNNMLSEEYITYHDVCETAAEELCVQIKNAELNGIPAWRVLTDPGLGFSKTYEQNLELLRHLPSFRSGLASWSFAAFHAPLMVGPSRKSFLGKLTGQEDPQGRDAVSLAAATNCIAKGADVVRMHDVKSISACIADDTHRWHRALSRVCWSI